MKYDSAGRLVATRTLGAASTASGYAIAIDANGDVAVAGSVTGALNTSTTDAGKTGEVANVADSFVTVFNKDGEEQWTQRRGARAADEATSVAFGADGIVYIGGPRPSRPCQASTARRRLGRLCPGLQGRRALSDRRASSPRPSARTSSAPAADDSVDAMTIDGSNLYTAGRRERPGRGAPLHPRRRRRADPGRDARPGRHLGRHRRRRRRRRQGHRDRDQPRQRPGRRDDDHNAHSGGKDVFVAALSTDLAAAGTDRLSWYGGAGDDTAADVKVHDGKVWITGIADRDRGRQGHRSDQGLSDPARSPDRRGRIRAAPGPATAIRPSP